MKKNSNDPQTPEETPDGQDDVDGCCCEDDTCRMTASTETEIMEDCCCCW